MNSGPAGLTTPEAARRLAAVGPNEPVTVKRASPLVQIARTVGSPIILILLAASAVSALLGDHASAVIIVLMVAMSTLLDFVQTHRSQQAAESLRSSVAPTAQVLRDGGWIMLPRRELVPGDVIRLQAGTLVPADAQLVEAHYLHVQQAALTGESLPVEKVAAKAMAGDAPATHAALPAETAAAEPPSPADTADHVFLGTSIVSGNATAVVIATGPRTAFGGIATRLAVRAPETAFERGLRQFGMLILQTVFFLVLFVFLVSVVLHRDPLESLLFAVALAVGLTPEFLPMITTVTLAEGAMHMARRKVIVKHLEAIQNFGSIDILCSDKTGTLTAGEMALEQHVDPLGTPADRPFLLGFLNSYHESGIEDPQDAAILAKRKAMAGESVKAAAAAALPGADLLDADPLNADPLDAAILHHAHPDVRASHKLGEIPFDFERRRMSVVTEFQSETLLITKGAPESILPISAAYEVDGQQQPLDAQARARCEATYEQLSREGFRVLAVAFKAVAAADRYGVEAECDLVLAGYLAFLDQPLPDAMASLEALRRDGVQVKILTGDNDLVTAHVCRAVGLDPGHIVLGDELDHMTDVALAHVAEVTQVFARVSPAQKNRIILALKQRNHVVGYMGDGINDAPSLHAADVGISVAGGVDVAKDAADIILLERSLAVLHEGILEGRRAFGNVVKYLLMGTSSNFGNMFSMAGAALFLPFLPMLPTQILVNNFLYDLSQVTIPTDNVDDTFMRKPKTWDVGYIREFMLLIGPISSIYDFLTFFVLLYVFKAHEALFHTGWFVESLATQTLVLFVIRTAGNPFASRPSRPLTVTVIVCVLIGALLPFSPLAGALGFVPLPPAYFAFLVTATGTYLALVQVAKRRVMARITG